MINRNHEQARRVDPTTVIGRRGTPYSCPNIAAVDRHIVRLYKRIQHAAPRLPELAEELWAEIDLLLDHRMWLELTLSEVRDAAVSRE
jgi:hypothetical protein